MLNKLEFKKIRDFGETINDTFTFIKQNFKALVTVFFYLCGFFLLATMISSIMQQIGLQKVMQSNNPNRGFELIRSMFNFQYGVTVILGIANYTAINVSILSFIALYIEKGKVAPTVEQVWSYFKYYYFRALGGILAISVFMVACALPCGIPLIYVFPAMSIFLPIMIFENGSLTFAFGRSFKLVNNNWGLTAGCIFIIWVITYATISFASLPAIIMSFVGGFTSGGKGLSTSVIIFSGIIQSLCQVFLIIPIIGTSICYFNLAERHENTGLLGRINNLGETKEEPTSTEEY